MRINDELDRSLCGIKSMVGVAAARCDLVWVPFAQAVFAKETLLPAAQIKELAYPFLSYVLYKNLEPPLNEALLVQHLDRRYRGSARNEDDEVASASTVGEGFDLTGEVMKAMPKATNSDRERVERAYKKTKLPQNFRNQDEIQDKMEAVADEQQRLLREMRENTLRIRKETLREFAKLQVERSTLTAQLNSANESRASHQSRVERLENNLARKKKALQSKMDQMSINDDTGNRSSSREMEEYKSRIDQLEKKLMTEKSLVAEKNEEIAR
ncbi:Hypothetical Protein FCC1311_063192, partial [Hondaea fermentalgiana]